jgi:hypothetical protein
LSLWGRLLYFCSKIKKYITVVPIGYKTDLFMFFQISRTQQKKRHAKRMTEAPRNGLQASAPQQLPCIKMALAWLLFSINLLYLSFMASNKPGFYRSEVGYPSPTSSQNLASKNAQYLPKMDKIQ